MKNFTDYQMYILEKAAVKCSDVEKLYGEYLEGDLPNSLKGRIDEHVHGCEECQEFVATYKLTISLAKELVEKKIPAEVQRRLRERLNQKLGINLEVR